jgi:Holliday junction resolvase RusA-like endonuclease
MEMQFYIPIKPEGKGRPRASFRNGRVQVYTPINTIAHEMAIRSHIKNRLPSGFTPLVCPLKAVITLGMPFPKGTSKKTITEALNGNLLPHTKKPDFDNIAKSVVDACNGVLYKDDAQIYDCHIIKRYAIDPYVQITITTT